MFIINIRFCTSLSQKKKNTWKRINKKQKWQVKCFTRWDCIDFFTSFLMQETISITEIKLHQNPRWVKKVWRICDNLIQLATQHTKKTVLKQSSRTCGMISKVAKNRWKKNFSIAEVRFFHVFSGEWEMRWKCCQLKKYFCVCQTHSSESAICHHCVTCQN